MGLSDLPPAGVVPPPRPTAEVRPTAAVESVAQVPGAVPTQRPVPRPDVFVPGAAPPATVVDPLFEPGQVVQQMAQDVLSLVGDPERPLTPQALLDAHPNLARTFRHLMRRYVAAGDGRAQVAMQALRSYVANTGRDVAGLYPGLPSNSLAFASAYAKDLGFSHVGFEADQFTLYDDVDAPRLLEFDPDGGVTLPQTLSLLRFGRSWVVPPSGALDPAPGFSLDNAHTANHLGLLVYGFGTTARSQLEAWGFAAGSTFTWLATARGADETTGFVVADRQGNLYVVLRGTDSATDLGTDLDAAKVPALWASPRGDLQVHRGFDTALESIWPELVEAVALAQKTAGDGGKVLFVGHSLGGALAELAALRLTLEPGLGLSKDRVLVYTNGAPRIGDDAFAAAYDAMLPETYRMVNVTEGGFWRPTRKDLVASVPPPWLGFRHPGQLVEVSPSAVTYRGRGDLQQEGTSESAAGLVSAAEHQSATYLERTGRALLFDARKTNLPF